MQDEEPSPNVYLKRNGGTTEIRLYLPNPDLDYKLLETENEVKTAYMRGDGSLYIQLRRGQQLVEIELLTDGTTRHEYHGDAC